MNLAVQEQLALGAVLFDLDGTLIDSAPDLAGTVNEMRLERGLPELPYPGLRAMVGAGARGMLSAGFSIGPSDTGFEAMRDEFLARYEARMLRLTTVFSGIPALLAVFERRGLPWGIVTNKAERFALPVTAGLGLHQRAAAVIGGDTTPRAKPHPDPLLEAARRIGADPCHCIYVGDDERDIQAGRAAGMRTVAAAWGYLGVGAEVEDWGADIVVDSPEQLLKWLQLA
jgi:phosphoglycolate phosphatase